jgi:hypothetical protein
MAAGHSHFPGSPNRGTRPVVDHVSRTALPAGRKQIALTWAGAARVLPDETSLAARHYYQSTKHPRVHSSAFVSVMRLLMPSALSRLCGGLGLAPNSVPEAGTPACKFIADDHRCVSCHEIKEKLSGRFRRENGPACLTSRVRHMILRVSPAAPVRDVQTRRARSIRKRKCRKSRQTEVLRFTSFRTNH